MEMGRWTKGMTVGRENKSNNTVNATTALWIQGVWIIQRKGCQLVRRRESTLIYQVQHQLQTIKCSNKWVSSLLCHNIISTSRSGHSNKSLRMYKTLQAIISRLSIHPFMRLSCLRRPACLRKQYQTWLMIIINQTIHRLFKGGRLKPWNQRGCTRRIIMRT